jgi:hypothetical protein
MRLVEAAGLGLPMHLEAFDPQHQAAGEWAAGRPINERDRWAREQNR